MVYWITTLSAWFLHTARQQNGKHLLSTPHPPHDFYLCSFIYTSTPIICSYIRGSLNYFTWPAWIYCPQLHIAKFKGSFLNNRNSTLVTIKVSEKQSLQFKPFLLNCTRWKEYSCVGMVPWIIYQQIDGYVSLLTTLTLFHMISTLLHMDEQIWCKHALTIKWHFTVYAVILE